MTIDYTICLHAKTYKAYSEYLNQLKQASNPEDLMGYELKAVFLEKKLNVKTMSIIDFIDTLLKTKKPCIFAENEILKMIGNVRRWNDAEIILLGNLNIAAETSIFDNESHPGPITTHIPSFQGHLFFTPGIILKKINGEYSPDAMAIFKKEQNGNLLKDNNGNPIIDDNAYFNAMEQRLLSLLSYSNRLKTKTIVTVPEIGCGAFSGQFSDIISDKFQATLQKIIEKHGAAFPNIAGIYSNYTEEKVYKKPIPHKTGKLPLLEKPEVYAKQLKLPEGKYTLVKAVAWDHISWPGNDFWNNNNRSTDDGASAAASAICYTLTGVKGQYDKKTQKYLPPQGMRDWEQVINDKNLTLKTEEDNIQKDGNIQLVHDLPITMKPVKPDIPEWLKMTISGLVGLITGAFTFLMYALPQAFKIQKKLQAEKSSEQDEKKNSAFNIASVVFRENIMHLPYSQQKKDQLLSRKAQKLCKKK